MTFIGDRQSNIVWSANGKKNRINPTITISETVLNDRLYRCKHFHHSFTLVICGHIIPMVILAFGDDLKYTMCKRNFKSTWMHLVVLMACMVRTISFFSILCSVTAYFSIVSSQQRFDFIHWSLVNSSHSSEFRSFLQ